jgi:hypothetical protein
MMSVKEKTPFTSVIGEMDVVPMFGAQFSLSIPVLDSSPADTLDFGVSVQLL